MYRLVCLTADEPLTYNLKTSQLKDSATYDCFTIREMGSRPGWFV